MTGNEDDLDEEQAMKMIWTMTTTTTKTRRNDNEDYVDNDSIYTTNRANDMSNMK